MRDLRLIGGFLITLFLGLASIASLRMYFRARMKGFLFMGVGTILGAFSFLGMTIWYISSDLRGYLGDTPMFLFLLVLLVAALTSTLGSVILATRESGLYKEIAEKSTLWQMVITGNVPVLKDKKPPPSAINKRTGISIGIIAMILGSSIIIPYIVFKIPTVFMSFFIAAIGAFVLGLLLVIFSIIYLDKGKK